MQSFGGKKAFLPGKKEAAVSDGIHKSSAHRLQGGARFSYAGEGGIYTLISASVWGASLSRGATRRRRQSTCSGQRPM